MAEGANNPVASAGYSLRPLVKKLGLAAGDRAVFVNEPDTFRAALGDLPDGIKVTTQLRGVKDYVHVFVTRAKDLKRKFERLVPVLEVDGMVWISWPKKASGVATDVDGAVVRSMGLMAGLVDVKVCAVDDVWSGHKFVFRKEDRDSIRAQRGARA